MYVYICVYMCVYIYIYTYTYICIYHSANDDNNGIQSGLSFDTIVELWTCPVSGLTIWDLLFLILLARVSTGQRTDKSVPCHIISQPAIEHRIASDRIASHRIASCSAI